LAYAQICQQEKVDELVDFPVEDLDIKQFVKTNCELKGISTKYDLYAVVNHYGSLNGGHYTSMGKNIDGKWYNFNDASVSELSRKRIQSDAAYVLFYRRRPDFDVSAAPAKVPKSKKKRAADEAESQASTQASQQTKKEDGAEESKDDEYIYQLD
jgi:hypothetical protein